jgi:hypothetical protein
MIEALKQAAARGRRRLARRARATHARSGVPAHSLARYLRWRTPDGEAFDPWVRVHLSM